jgi:hypothetical protein
MVIARNAKNSLEGAIIVKMKQIVLRVNIYILWLIIHAFNVKLKIVKLASVKINAASVMMAIF